MKKITTILLLVVSGVSFAQYGTSYSKGDTIYYNRWYRTVAKEIASRYGVIRDIQEKENQKLYQLEYYKLDTVSKTFFKEQLFFCKSPKYLLRTGKVTIFWQNGQKKKEGIREEGNPIGIWTEWYDDGTKMAEYEYFEPQETPKSKQKGYHLVNFWNRDGEINVKDGTGNYFLKDENGDEVLGEMLNYNRVGLWRGFRKDGSKWYEDIYKEGEFVQGKSWDEEGNLYTYISIVEKGGYSEGREGLVKVISENFTVPRYASRRGIEGTTNVYFEVNKKGKVEAIEVAKSLCEPCDQEAIRVLKLLENWKPGKFRGQISRTKYTLPFRIKLE